MGSVAIIVPVVATVIATVVALEGRPRRQDLLPNPGLARLRREHKWGRVASTTGPVAPEVVASDAVGRLLLLASPSCGRSRSANREDR
jgi:hypothetical protein